jgi:hypothetical protein
MRKKNKRVLALVLSLCRQVVCLVGRDYEKVCESCGGDEVVSALKVPLTYHDGKTVDRCPFVGACGLSYLLRLRG